MRRLKSDLWDNRIAIVIIAIYLSVTQIVFNEVCPLKLLFGIPCPGCGLTRGCISVFTMQWRQSLEYNPVSILWIAAIVYFIIRRYFVMAGESAQYNYVLLAVIVLVTFSVYIYRIKAIYPGVEPMTYYEDNLAAVLNIINIQ